MAYAQTSGVRGLQVWRFTQDFISAKAQNVFSAEVAGSVTGKELLSVVAEIDKVAATKQNSSWRQEHTEAFALARDFRYGHRSRKWLFAKALRTRCDQAYEGWMSFLRENVILHPSISKLPKRDIVALSNAKFSETLPP